MSAESANSTQPRVQDRHDPATTEAAATVVVVPRERFSFARESLESLFANTSAPFELVYVDGNSPPALREYLRGQAQARGFQLISTDSYLSPNTARNLGLGRVRTPYVAFVDNDVLFAADWLERLVACAEETGAAVVGPLTFQGTLERGMIHCAGGDAHITSGPDGRRGMRERMNQAGRRLRDVEDQLEREQCELAEFHGLLARTQIFDRIGPLDEALLSTREHIDFCLAVIAAGGTVWFEPDSRITYVPPPSLKPEDRAFYRLRWNAAWEQSSLRHFADKWRLDDKEFRRRMRRVGMRRRLMLFRPLTGWLGFGRRQSALPAPLRLVERLFDRVASLRNRRSANPSGVDRDSQ